MNALSAVIFVLAVMGCTPRDDEARTVLPTKQAIDSVSKKLDAAQQETEKRRAEIDNVGK
jgi:hypothetical protein